jgi:hypothetical protein
LTLWAITLRMSASSSVERDAHGHLWFDDARGNRGVYAIAAGFQDFNGRECSLRMRGRDHPALCNSNRPACIDEVAHFFCAAFRPGELWSQIWRRPKPAQLALHQLSKC